MPAIIDYILKLNICLAVVYLFYQLFLRRLTFYNWNRWYLLGYTALSFIIPLIDIMPSLEKRALQENAVMQWIPAINFVSPQKQNFFETLSYWDWAIGALLLGSFALLIRFVIRFYSFKRMKAKAELISNDVTKIYQLNEPITPFSFGNSIFINTEMHSGDELEEIIRHEFVHVKQKHTIDIMWCELLCMLNWFNPAVWLLRLSVKQNLEFIADSKVLQNGFDRKEYQYLLLKVMGNRQFAFTNHFNFSSLKKRIAMMNTIKSAKIHLIKFMFLLPVVAVLLLSFRKEVNELKELEIAKKETLISGDFSTKVRNAVGDSKKPVWVIDGIPVIITGSFSMAYFDADEINNSDDFKVWVNGKIVTMDEANKMVDRFNAQSVGASPKASAEKTFGIRSNLLLIATTKEGEQLMRQRLGMQTDTVPGKKNNVLSIIDSKNPDATPLIVIDGEVKDAAFDINNLNADDIESVEVLKGASGISLYGEKAADGVLKIATKKGVDRGVVELGSAKTVTVHTDKTVMDGHPAINLRNIKPGEEPLFFLNGEPIEKGTFDYLDPNKIESITILKDASAKALYGSKATNGVLLITTKTDSGKGTTFVAKSDSVTFIANTESAFSEGAGKVAAQSNRKAVAVRGHTTKGSANSLKGQVSGVRIEPSKTTDLKEVTVVGYSAKDKFLSNPPANVHYVLNGEDVKYDEVKRLSGDNIKSIDVLKGDQAKKFYGNKAKEGAIVITTKQN